MAIKLTSSLTDSNLLSKFYAAYDRCFSDSNQKETYDGFKLCLELNKDVGLQNSYGPFREIILIYEDDSEVIGGANFVCFDHTGISTIHLNYAFVLPNFRKRGVLKQIVAEVHQLVEKLFKQPVITFIEVGDSTNRAIWTRLGANFLNYNYIQPPLSEDHDADSSMILGMFGEEITAKLLHNHLYKFFSVSVLKGKNAYTNPDSRKQLRSLNKMKESVLTYEIQ